MSQSLIAKKVETLRASLKTIQYQIANLQKFYSKEQVYCWKVQRFKLRKQLEFHERMLKAANEQNQKQKHENSHTKPISSALHGVR